MGLFKAQLSAGPFKRGEIVEVDETEFARYIERGWLKPYTEGMVVVSGSERADDANDSTEDASSVPPDDAGGASPSDEQ